MSAFRVDHAHRSICICGDQLSAVRKCDPGDDFHVICLFPIKVQGFQGFPLLCIQKGKALGYHYLRRLRHGRYGYISLFTDAGPVYVSTVGKSQSSRQRILLPAFAQIR